MESFLYLGLGILVLFIVASLVLGGKRERQLKDARAEYWQSLAHLQADPANADLRQRTLLIGRVYSNLTRNRRGVTVFDEVALINDISAACAGAAHVKPKTAIETIAITGNPDVDARLARVLDPPKNSGTGPKADSIEDRLLRLADLKAKGLIDEQEYRTQKQKILDEV